MNIHTSTDRGHSQSQPIAVLIPCYNEEQTVAQVVRDFRAQLPYATIYVFDNGSTDRTVDEARLAGAVIHCEPRRGKGYVLQQMFRKVEAEIYVMVDGDGTYPAERVHQLIQPVADGLADMVIGSRLHPMSQSAFKLPNKFGNWVFRVLVNTLFRVEVTDLLSGYRALSHTLVKSLPFLSHGFESETELTIKCLVREFRIQEIPVDLRPRQGGSLSKIRLLQDGLLILHTVIALARDYRPLTAFGLIGAGCVLLGLFPGGLVLHDFLTTGYVHRMPSAILAVGLVLTGLLTAFTGLALHAIARHFQEIDHELRNLLEHLHDLLKQSPRASSESAKPPVPP